MAQLLPEQLEFDFFAPPAPENSSSLRTRLNQLHSKTQTF